MIKSISNSVNSNLINHLIAYLVLIYMSQANLNFRQNWLFFQQNSHKEYFKYIYQNSAVTKM